MRARGNRDPFPTRVIESAPVPQPPLPEAMPDGRPWPQITRAWWRMWGKDPLAADFRATDWAELRDTAAIHGAYWSGDFKLAGELRLRTAKFGATAEDRARLRIQYAAADKADEKRERARHGADSRYVGLRAVDPAD
ncbi:MAG: hypothetical protein Q4E11_07565 [Corynebacterium sp.]|uniref:phage terminase small subunit n=1 Tax=Corynebacterium sp. TaxID=1720 RepID=UPI0026DAA5B1|nr:hypothetical protein [Corynebacterium sp.]MDO5030425.1 hypothetical protein [Corynebacterium sp.]